MERADYLAKQELLQRECAILDARQGSQGQGFAVFAGLVASFDQG